MRAQRNYMVQTEDQYVFIHDALQEAVNCGTTEVPARNLYAYIQKLTQIEGGENVTGMELEFKVKKKTKKNCGLVLFFALIPKCLSEYWMETIADSKFYRNNFPYARRMNRHQTGNCVQSPKQTPLSQHGSHTENGQTLPLTIRRTRQHGACGFLSIPFSWLTCVTQHRITFPSLFPPFLW